MFSDRLNDQDMKDYQQDLGGADIVDDVGFGTIAAQSFKSTLKVGPTAALWDMAKSGFNALNRVEKPEDSLTGLEANSKFGLEGEFAFDPDEKVYPEDANSRNERAFSSRVDAMSAHIADAKGTNVTFASIVGGLGGGIADPVSLIGGAVIGNLARAKTAMMLASATDSATIITAAKFPGLYKAAGAAATADTLAANALEGMVGAAIIDLPAQGYFMAKYNEDFSTREFIMQMAGAGVFGAALPAVLKPILRPAKKILGQNLVGKAQQAFKNKWIKTFASDSEVALMEFSALVDIGEKMDATPDESILDNLRHVEMWEIRGDDVHYSAPEITNREDFDHIEWHIGRRSGEKKFREVSGHGVGTTILLDDPNLAKNSVQDLNGKHGGEVKSVRVRPDTKVLSPDVFDANKEIILKDFADALASTIKSKQAGADLKSSMQELAVLKKEMSSATNMNELHDIVSSSPVSRHPEMYLNSVIKKQGFDAYHVRVDSPHGEKMANGLVMIDAVNSQQLAKGETTAEFVNMVGKDEFTTDDGIVSFFDETKLEVTNRKAIAKADLDDDGVKALRKGIADTHSNEVKRMATPQAKKTHIPPAVSEEDLAKVVADDTTDAASANVKDSLDALESKGLVGKSDEPSIINEADKEFVDNLPERLKASDDFASDLDNCILGKE